MQRKYDLVANMYLDLFEKREKYQNHIRALSASSCAVDDKQPEPPSRFVNRKNRYMEMQKKFFQLGVENSKAVTSLPIYSKYYNKNPKIVEPRTNLNNNQAEKIDWMKPYNSSPLPGLKSTPGLFNKTTKKEQNSQLEEDNDYHIKEKINKESTHGNKKKNNSKNANISKEENNMDKNKDEDIRNTNNLDAKKDPKHKNDNTILFLTEPETKDPEEIDESKKEGALENTINSVSNKILDDNNKKTENEIENDFEDDFENEEADADNSNDKEKEKIEKEINDASNLLLNPKENESDKSNNFNLENERSETDELNLKNSESSKDQKNNEKEDSNQDQDNFEDDFDNFE